MKKIKNENFNFISFYAVTQLYYSTYVQMQGNVCLKIHTFHAQVYYFNAVLFKSVPNITFKSFVFFGVFM